MKKYGSKDIMRMESIKTKARGDYMQQLIYAYNMACAITEPGKAMARGFSAQEVFGEYSAVAQVFFEKAIDLGGENVRPVASVNSWEDTDEGIEGEYEGIPDHQLPASRRKALTVLPSNNFKTPFSKLVYLGKLNVIKGTGPQFNLFDHIYGTLEIWQTEDEKYRIVYTSHYDPIYSIGDERVFKYDHKVVTWKMVDYIEVEYAANLAPLYGKSIAIFNHD